MINREKTFDCLKRKEINVQYGGSQFCLYIRTTWAIKNIYTVFQNPPLEILLIGLDWDLGIGVFFKKFPRNSKTELRLKSSNIDYISNRNSTRKGWNPNRKMGKEYEPIIFRTEITNA